MLHGDDDDDDDDDDVGRQLEPECAAELKQVRRSLLEDYRISPLVEASCEADVRNHCSDVEHRQVIHCLMDVARRQSRRPHAAAAAGKPLSKSCYRQVCLSLCLSVSLSLCLSVCLSVCLFVCFVNMSASFSCLPDASV